MKIVNNKIYTPSESKYEEMNKRGGVKYEGTVT